MRIQQDEQPVVRRACEGNHVMQPDAFHRFPHQPEKVFDPSHCKAPTLGLPAAVEAQRSRKRCKRGKEISGGTSKAVEMPLIEFIACGPESSSHAPCCQRYAV